MPADSFDFYSSHRSGTTHWLRRFQVHASAEGGNTMRGRYPFVMKMLLVILVKTTVGGLTETLLATLDYYHGVSPGASEK